MFSSHKKIVIGLLASTIISGCSVVQDSTRNISSTTSNASGHLAQAALPMPAADISPIKHNSGVYVGSKSVLNENGDPLPSKNETKSAITIVKSSPMNLREIATLITQQTQIPVVVSGGTEPAESGSRASASDNSAPQMGAGPIPDGFPLEAALAQITPMNSPSVSRASQVSLPINYEGPLSGFLDVVSAQYDVAWVYKSGRIIFDSVVTRNFDVPALAMVSSMKFDLSSKSSTDGDGSAVSAGQDATASSETDVLKELDATLTEMMNGQSGNYSVNRATGLVTVTSSPAVVARVSSYLSTLNQRLSQQVALSVQVYSVSLNDRENFDLDIKGLFTKAAKYGISFGSGGAASGVVPAATGGPGLGWALLDTGSKWNGSNALLSALSERGDVSVVTTASVTTVSGIPVPLQVGEERDYVKKVEVTAGESESTASIEPGTVSTGFSLQINPRVERNGDILVQYGINISELTGSEDGFDTFETLGTKVQLRRINQRNFIQQARIPNNNTLVLAGFEQVRNETKKRGVGNVNFPFFGGGSIGASKREIIVIMITPTLLNSR